MHPDPIFDQVCKQLVAAHAVHTMLLYGSRADGSASRDSDYDVAAFAPIERSFRVARLVDGAYLDVFVYPEALLFKPSEEHLKLIGSRVVLQRGTEAEDFLSRLDEIYRRGPEPLPSDEIAARKVWAHKMVARMRRADPEGNYRRVWLLTALLEDYFQLRGLWFEGPKKSLRWLEQFDVPTFDAMRAALEPNASEEAVSSVVRLVVGKLDA
jgi:predicted nucleotidyltransferase